MEIAEELNHAKELMHQGRLKKALSNVERLGKSVGLPDRDQFACELLKSNILSRLPLDEALKYCQKELILFKEIGNKLSVAWALSRIGDVFRWKGETSQALRYYNESLILYEQIGKKREIAYSLTKIGSIYRWKGQLLEYLSVNSLNEDLDQALKYFQQSFDIHEEIGDINNIIRSLDSIGDIYRLKDDSDQALKYYKRSLNLRKEIGLKKDVATSLYNIGHICSLKNDLNQALKYFQLCLDYFEEFGDIIMKSNILFELVSITIEKDNLDLANHYFHRLKLINKTEDNLLINQQCRVAESLLLKTKNRLIHKAKAQEILQNVIDEDSVINLDIRFKKSYILAIFNLCELLIDELKCYGEREVLIQIKALLAKIFDFISLLQEYRAYYYSYISYYSSFYSHISLSLPDWQQLLIRSLMLKAKFSLIEGDAESAFNILEQAMVLSSKMGLIKLHQEVIEEKEYLSAELEKWEELYTRNAPLKDRIEKVRMNQYFPKPTSDWNILTFSDESFFT
ncbi:MAG: tetratricopeptide repeat protein [Candidatus Hodarchaeales archaeon]|jgi:tetratricopeptide (TPR) repeat protein